MLLSAWFVACINSGHGLRWWAAGDAPQGDRSAMRCRSHPRAPQQTLPWRRAILGILADCSLHCSTP
jgi:hypothetical protein